MGGSEMGGFESMSVPEIVAFNAANETPKRWYDGILGVVLQRDLFERRRQRIFDNTLDELQKFNKNQEREL